MAQAEAFPFIVVDAAFGEASRLPYMPITLELQGRSLAVSALLDTGSAVNVLPYEVGLQLGADWDRQITTVRLTGNLANEPARVLTVLGTIGTLRLRRGWYLLGHVPLPVPVILGPVNFFMEFDVCFYCSRSRFEVNTKSAVQAY